jgi:hypothetical protein
VNWPRAASMARGSRGHAGADHLFNRVDGRLNALDEKGSPWRELNKNKMIPTGNRIN